MADYYGYITADAWAKGIGYSILASIVGGASKLAIRKSWLMVQDDEEPDERNSSLMAQSSNHSENDDERCREMAQRNIDAPPNGEGNINLRQKPDKDNTNESTSTTGEVVRRDEKLGQNSAALCLRYSGMFGMTFVNPAFCVLAMNYASPSILAPFSGLTLVWIILCSEYFISERPQTQQIFAACLIITGQVIVGIFGDHTNDDGITLEEV